MANPREVFMQMLAKKKAAASGKGKGKPVGPPVNAEGETASQETKDAADIKARNTPVKKGEFPPKGVK